MKLGKYWGVLGCALIFVMGPGFLGCRLPQKAQGLFAKQELGRYGRLAVLGLTAEQEQIFMAAYIKAFGASRTTFVERARLDEVLKEQERNPKRLNETTRARMQEILGVEALIECEYYASASPAAKKLRVRVVDCETGAITGSVITTAGDSFESHCLSAVRALRGELSRY